MRARSDQGRYGDVQEGAGDGTGSYKQVAQFPPRVIGPHLPAPDAKRADVGIASQQEVLLLEPIQSYLSPSDKFTFVSWNSIQARLQRFCPPQMLVHAFRCVHC